MSEEPLYPADYGIGLLAVSLPAGVSPTGAGPTTHGFA